MIAYEDIDVSEYLKDIPQYENLISTDFLIDYTTNESVKFSKRIVYTINDINTEPSDSLTFMEYKDFVQLKEDENQELEIAVTISPDVESAFKMLHLYLIQCTNPNIPKTGERGIFIGDLAFGGSDTSIVFVRGNVFVKACNPYKTETSVIKLAEAIDAQLTALLLQKSV